MCAGQLHLCRVHCSFVASATAAAAALSIVPRARASWRMSDRSSASTRSRIERGDICLLGAAGEKLSADMHENVSRAAMASVAQVVVADSSAQGLAGAKSLTGGQCRTPRRNSPSATRFLRQPSSGRNSAVAQRSSLAPNGRRF